MECLHLQGQGRQLVRESLSDQLNVMLKQRIMSGEYKAGQRIDLQSLAQEMAVSAAPLRDALHRLAERGLVTIKPRVGCYVRKLSPRETSDLFDLRLTLEAEALRTSIDSMPSREVHALQERLIALQDSAGEVESVVRVEMTLVDESLHSGLIVGHCTNEFLRTQYEAIRELILMSTRLVSRRKEDDLQEHLRIADALSRRSLFEAREALSAHLTRAKDATVSGILKEKGVQ